MRQEGLPVPAQAHARAPAQPHPFQATVTGLVFEKGRVSGCRPTWISSSGRCVVVTTGTFLRGLMHIGQNKNEGRTPRAILVLRPCRQPDGNRHRAAAPEDGHATRILGRSIDFQKMQEQKATLEPTLFAFHDTRDPEDLFHVEHSGERRLGWVPGTEQVSCWMTHTTESTAQIVRAICTSRRCTAARSRHRTRYCPSIEDKFVRFADKPRGICCSWNPRAAPPTNIMSTDFRRRCRSMCSSTWSTAFRVSKGRPAAAGLCRRI
jgi:tRNA uridine 5-carboxymethylaminomethyl modification enzyme